MISKERYEVLDKAIRLFYHNIRDCIDAYPKQVPPYFRTHSFTYPFSGTPQFPTFEDAVTPLFEHMSSLVRFCHDSLSNVEQNRVYNCIFECMRMKYLCLMHSWRYLHVRLSYTESTNTFTVRLYFLDFKALESIGTA